MKYLMMFLFTFTAQAKDCFLSYDQSQTLFVDCRVGPLPPEYTRVCPIVDGERDGSLYNAEIVTRDVDGNILTSRQWTFSDVLGPGEDILCSISASRKQAKADAQAAREAAQAQERQDKEDARAVLVQQCQAVADPFRNAVCELLGAK